MKVTDEMVEAACRVWHDQFDADGLTNLIAMRAALEAALAAAPQPMLTVLDLQQALVDTGIVCLEAIDDAEEFDDGVTLEQIDELHKMLTQAAPDALREAARMALEAADSVVSQLSALHRATMGYEDACVLRGAELVADALREALGEKL